MMSAPLKGLSNRLKRGSRSNLIAEELGICNNAAFDARYVFEISWEVVNKGWRLKLHIIFISDVTSFGVL